MEKGRSLASKLWIWQPFEIRTRRSENFRRRGKILPLPLPSAAKFEPRILEPYTFFKNYRSYQRLKVKHYRAILKRKTWRQK